MTAKSVMRKQTDPRDQLSHALLACADWAYLARQLLRDRTLLPETEAHRLSVALLAFERAVLGQVRVDMEAREWKE